MQQQLLQLAGCGLPWAQQRAQTALQIEQALQQNQVSRDEARSLLTDLINVDQLNQEATDAEARAMLVFGITQILELCA
jgi:hypothetical protein